MRVSLIVLRCDEKHMCVSMFSLIFEGKHMRVFYVWGSYDGKHRRVSRSRLFSVEKLFFLDSAFESLSSAQGYTAHVVSRLYSIFSLLPCWRSMLPAGGTDWVVQSEAPFSAATMTVWKKDSR